MQRKQKMSTQTKHDEVEAADDKQAMPPTTSQSIQASVNQKQSSSQSTRTCRGRTHLDSLTKERAEGIKKVVDFDSKGRPIGENGALLQSYVGVLAREKVKITHDSWKQVPKEDKEQLWQAVNLSFVVPSSWKASCLKSANDKWKQYKSSLTKNFVKARCHNAELLNMPPHNLPQADWSQFVISRMSTAFAEISQVQSERSLMNEYRHKLARKGYGRFENELGDQLGDDEEVKRAELWKRARASKGGEYEGTGLKEKVGKINECIHLRQEGKLEVKGCKEDILTVALNTKEHPGRVRAVGSQVTPTVYFNTPKQKGHKTDMQKQWMEAIERLQKLEAVVFKPSPSSVNTDEKGSCSAKTEHPVQSVKTEPVRSLHSEIKPNDDDDDDVVLVGTLEALQGKQVSLTLAESSGAVALGIVVSTEPLDQMTACVLVAIDTAIDGAAQLPIKTGELLSISDAVGGLVPWPVHLVRLQPKANTSVGSKKKPSPSQAQELEPTLQPSSMPKALYILYKYSIATLKDGSGLPVDIPADVFGSECNLLVFLDDVIPFCKLEPIGANCIVIYIWYSHQI